MNDIQQIICTLFIQFIFLSFGLVDVIHAQRIGFQHLSLVDLPEFLWLGFIALHIWVLCVSPAFLPSRYFSLSFTSIYIDFNALQLFFLLLISYFNIYWLLFSARCLHTRSLNVSEHVCVAVAGVFISLAPFLSYSRRVDFFAEVLNV